jgi:hypothetical protein
MALCVDSLTLVDPCFLCALQDRNKTSRGHHLLISQSQTAAAPSLERKTNVWLTLLQTNPPDSLAYKSCVKPFFILAFKMWLCLHRLEFSICSMSPKMDLHRHLFRKTLRISTRIKERKEKKKSITPLTTISIIF